MSVAQPGKFTPREYLGLETRAEIKHELVNGQIVAMAGKSPAHNRVAFNLTAALGQKLLGGPCQGFTSDQRVSVPETELYTYPDLSVVCGEPRYDPGDPETLVNPTLLAEVLSPSTGAWDRGGKFAHYRRLPSLQEYLMVAQDRHRVERYVRQVEEWVLTEFSSPDDAVELSALGVQISLREIYDRVPFPEQPAR